ncbi:hypothetical protein DFO61_0635 [Ectopseudomonas oleovorans]|uniref:Uncharacterized protein n=1 Tax=Ectopseudomonas oleovorans TaxID=301 RepID=A0A397NKS9_ECTOL|nr:hypothetical protein [Pseudomonas oleovorans]RIA36173.1 hypothetical protein DFO61_0635 [Pseudomonas oleovorans]
MSTIDVVRFCHAKINEYKLLWLCARVSLVFLAFIVTHYAGFITNFPIWVVSAAAVDLFPTFSALFIFYVTFCYSVARVMSFLVSQFVVAVSITTDSVDRRGHKFLWLRKYIKRYKNRSDEESVYYWGLTTFSFVGLLFLIYVRPSDFTLGSVSIGALVVLVVAAVLKMDVMVLSPKRVASKVMRKARYRNNLLSSMGFVFFGVILSISYYAGDLRFSRLINESPVEYVTSGFKSNLVVLISNADAVLGLEETENSVSWVYFSKGVVMRRSYEKKQDHESSEESASDS